MLSRVQVCVCVCVRWSRLQECADSVCVTAGNGGLKSQSGWIKVYFARHCSALLTRNTHQPADVSRRLARTVAQLCAANKPWWMQAPKTEDFVWLVEKNFAGESRQLLKRSGFNLETFWFFFQSVRYQSSQPWNLWGWRGLFKKKKKESNFISFHNIFPTSLSLCRDDGCYHLCQWAWIKHLVSPTRQLNIFNLESPIVYSKYLQLFLLLFCPAKYHPCKLLCLRNSVEGNNTFFFSPPTLLLREKHIPSHA